MKKIYLAFTLALFASSITNAQNWMVGVPVALEISALSLSTFNCYPTARANVNYPTSPVDGVEYAIVINSASPVNGVEIGNWGVVNTDDTLWMTQAGPYPVYFNMNQGSIEFSIWAIGTPTTIGQGHPCEFNDLWMSNLLFCFEGLNGIVNNACETEASTGIDDLVENGVNISYPSALNGERLSFTTTSPYSSASVYDLKGSVISEMGSVANGFFDLSDETNGLYILTITLENGATITKKFILE